MSYTNDDLIQFTNQYLQFQAAIQTAQEALNKVVSTGTIIYNSTTAPQLYPTTFAAFQAYLVQFGNTINTFMAAVPAAPPLSKS